MELKTIKCENCGTENSSEFIFCGKCGERIDGKFYCPNCDQLLDKGTSFCLNCGKRFDGKKTCPQCQNIVDEEFNYCGNCGFSFVEKNIVEKKSNNNLIENASSQFIQTKKKEKVVKKPKCNGDYKAKPLIKYSLISLLALVMLILSFMPIFNEAEISKNVAETYYDGVELKNIKFSAIDYIGFLNDIDVANRTLRIQDISFDNKVEDLWYEINDLDSTDTSRKAKSLLTKIIKYEFKSLIREEVFYSNNEMKGINTHFINMGILSILYILSSLIVFIISMIKLIDYLKTKKNKFKRTYNFLLAIPLVFVLPMMLVGKIFPSTSFISFPLNIDGCLIAFLCLNIVMLIVNAIFYFMDKSKDINFIRKLISICLIAISIGVCAAPLFNINTQVIPKDRISVRTYSAGYRTMDLLGSFNQIEEQEQEDVALDSYIEAYIEKLENTDHRDIDSDNLKLLLPSVVFSLYKLEEINVVFRATYRLNILIYYLLSLCLAIAYSTFFSEEKKRSKLLLLFLFITIAAIATVIILVIIVVASFNYIYLDSIYYTLGPGSILLMFFSLSAIIASAISTKRKKDVDLLTRDV